MNDITKLIVYLFVANIIAWYQIQGQFLTGKVGKFLNNDLTIIIV